MIKVLFFGRLREELGCDEKQLPWGVTTADLAAVEQTLIDEGGDIWGELLQQDNIIRAVNQQVANSNLSLADGDEVAFFPPVTGG